MSARIYVDTNVYLDYFEDRSDGVRPLGEFAFSVFRRALECEFEVVISDLILKELKRNNAMALKFSSLIDDLLEADKLIEVTADNDERAEAKTKENRDDALHAILANRSGCEYLVTRNIDHFLGLSGLVKPVFPEQL